MYKLPVICLSVGCLSSLASFGKPQLWRDAISQNAFDTSAGAGIFLVYATYMKRSHGVMKIGILAPLANNCIRSVCPFGEFMAYACFSIQCRCNFSIWKLSSPSSAISSLPLVALCAGSWHFQLSFPVSCCKASHSQILWRHCRTVGLPTLESHLFGELTQ